MLAESKSADEAGDTVQAKTGCRTPLPGPLAVRGDPAEDSEVMSRPSQPYRCNLGETTDSVSHEFSRYSHPFELFGVGEDDRREVRAVRVGYRLPY